MIFESSLRLVAVALWLGVRVDGVIVAGSTFTSTTTYNMMVSKTEHPIDLLHDEGPAQ